MSPAASASQYLWSIPSHGLRDFELPPTGKENEVRVGPGGVNKDTVSSQQQGSELQPFQTPSHLPAVPTSGPSPLLHILSLPPAARVPPLPMTHRSHSPPPESPVWTRPKLLPSRAGLCLLQLDLSPSLALSRLPHLPVVPGRSSRQSFPAPCLS